MAKIKSAQKRARQSKAKHFRNRMIKTQVKTILKDARSTMESGSPEEKQVALNKAVAALQKASNKGLYHKKNVARRISRLASQMHKSTL